MWNRTGSNKDVAIPPLKLGYNVSTPKLGHSRAAESVAAQQRRCELSKGLVSRARMLYANSEGNREPERARASKREPERASLTS